jgi:hypothetical protein
MDDVDDGYSIHGLIKSVAASVGVDPNQCVLIDEFGNRLDQGKKLREVGNSGVLLLKIGAAA